MDPITLGLLIGGGGGLLKHFIFDKPAADRARAAEAEKERYSPWTGHQEQSLQDPNLGSDMLQFGAAGAGLGANIQSAQNTSSLQNKMGKYYQSNTPTDSGGNVANHVVPANKVMPQPQSQDLRLGNTAATQARRNYVPQAQTNRYPASSYGPPSPYRGNSPYFMGPPSQEDLSRYGWISNSG